MALPENHQPAFDFKIQSSEVKQKGQGVLFYVLPPLVVAAVFAYCHLDSQKAEPAHSAAVKRVKAKPVYSTTAQFIEDDEEDASDE